MLAKRKADHNLKRTGKTRKKDGGIDHSNDNDYLPLPGLFSILDADALYAILTMLDLYDLRFLAMTSKAFYMNVYNPNGWIFNLLLDKLSKYWNVPKEDFDSLFTFVFNNDTTKKKSFMLSSNISKLNDFFDVYQSSDKWTESIGGYVTLTCAKNIESTIACYVKSAFTFRDIREIAFGNVIEFTTDDKTFNELYSSAPRFKTIRHWLASCLGCELHQLNMEEAAQQIIMHIKRTDKQFHYYLI
jgi:hypothetical protein